MRLFTFLLRVIWIIRYEAIARRRERARLALSKIDVYYMIIVAKIIDYNGITVVSILQVRFIFRFNCVLSLFDKRITVNIQM